MVCRRKGERQGSADCVVAGEYGGERLGVEGREETTIGLGR
jgi:hypothetical protein